MPQKKHVKLDVISYRKIVLDRGTVDIKFKGMGRIFAVNEYEWNVILKILPPEEHRLRLDTHLVYARDKPLRLWKFGETKNHPLVDNGLAFWLNNKTLITGYTLKNNPKIYRPIFQVYKEKLNFQLREEIRFYAKFYVAHKRQMLYKKTLMNIEALNIIPESIINMIAHLTYDYSYYLKL